MKSSRIRELFFEYFETRGHQKVPSSPLLPADDPTLLFTNAGMVQFKDVFVGKDKRSYVRAVSSQRCLRAGGKHNDLENVGYTARHHTFFEMLGNFSFGDYFKLEAIRFAWDFLTIAMGLPGHKLWVTVYEDDDEAADLWLNDIRIAPERLIRVGDKVGGARYESDNFWAMGDTGPCGPCSEIFYDHGADVEGGPPGSPDEHGDRFIEVWNLVFMQYERAEDGTLSDLPAPSVDTGMGLERIAAIMQGVHNNYEIDLFENLIEAARLKTGTKDPKNPSLNVIADHIRACAFLITDGVLPSNEGRGYVLRRIIRRAIRHGYKLGMHEPFFNKLVAPLEDEMGEAFPELTEEMEHVQKTLLAEEERFAETLENGMGLLEDVISELEGEVIPGDTVFMLYDTYGFPADLTADIARERGLSIDEAGFEAAMDGQRDQSRAASQFAVDVSEVNTEGLSTTFSGYEGIIGEGTVIALYQDGERVEHLSAGEAGQVVMDVTPFYAESGGQVGDTGRLMEDSAEFHVEDTQKVGDAVLHIGNMIAGELVEGVEMTGRVDRHRRHAIVLNHTATHLMHAALRAVLGTHVKQKGSLVAPDRLRFDFAHSAPVQPEELAEVEDLVNEWIRDNEEVGTREMGFGDAIDLGALAFFDDKYGETVRVLTIGDISVELCGGTHVGRAGDIGFFTIVSETGISSGVRRIEAVTGDGAMAWVRENDMAVKTISEFVRGSRADVIDKVQALVERSRAQEKEIEALRGKLTSGESDDLSETAVEVAGMKLVAARVDGADAKALRDAIDKLKDKLGSAAVVLAAVEDGKVRLAAGVTKDLTATLTSTELVNHVAVQVGGKGGGRADFAQAGGDDPEALDAALASVEPWLSERGT